MNPDIAFPAVGTALNAGLLAVLLYRRTFRTLPSFFTYQAYNTCAAAAGWIVYSRYPRFDLQCYLLDLLLDTILYLFVFQELGRRLLRYNRTSESRGGLAVLLFILATSLVWSLVQGVIPSHFPPIWQFASRAMQACVTIEVATVLALVWWSSLQKLRWPFCELQLASGLGFYSLVALGVAFAHVHGLYRPQDHWLDRLPPACDVLILFWWIRYFWFSQDGTGEGSSPSAGARYHHPDHDGASQPEPESKWVNTLRNNVLRKPDATHITFGH